MFYVNCLIFWQNKVMMIMSVCLSVVCHFCFTVRCALLPEIKDSILFYSILTIQQLHPSRI